MSAASRELPYAASSSEAIEKLMLASNSFTDFCNRLLLPKRLEVNPLSKIGTTERATVAEILYFLQLQPPAHWKNGVTVFANYARKYESAKLGRNVRNYLTIALLQNGVAYKCSLCETAHDTFGKRLRLHVDHYSGDASDCRIENLRFLCPNCHGQQPTSFSSRFFTYLDLIEDEE